ncbi:protein tyrosine phosphatase [Burkholderia pyrrocinia]|uniref:protein-tyrosine-phosphatase n=1 Tax=Burkholderia pyrrocinia TaxID=60550 RepID=A0A2Z5N6R7_BURPY|nr:low molecular weight protein-tyrosine-phosphatase [Burkholderia pyrrocinia]AXF24648.1 protein tyrosine phosphatase [Burkholderia pyrrocinia]
MSAATTLVVVCIGNVCRSPMAEALFRARLPDVDVQSAGLGALVGQPADPHAVALMRERGLDIAAHRARQLPAWLATRADLILTMDSGQTRGISHRYPHLRGRVFRLGDGAPHGFDVPDPHLGTRASFERSLALIERGIAGWCARIAPDAPPDGTSPSAPSPRLPD